MTLDADIRDQAYQFFIQEAPELLQVMETELLTLRHERTTTKIHSVMRAAHSIKGGAASVGLEGIKILAHRLEDFFKALHNEEVDFNQELESYLLQAYDCLRIPLMEQISTGYFNAEQAIAIAEPVFAQIEEHLGDFLNDEEYLPSSVELGIDITLSIFEVDVTQALDRLVEVMIDPDHHQVAGEFRAQAEVFSGIGELLNLPGFAAIANTTRAALDAHPERVLDIAKVALADFQAAKIAVIGGDRISGGSPSPALIQLANPSDSGKPIAPEPEPNDFSPDSTFYSEKKIAAHPREPSLDDVFGSSVSDYSTTELVDFSVFPEIEESSTFALNDIFGSSVSDYQTPEVEDLEAFPIDAAQEELSTFSLDTIFGSHSQATTPDYQLEVDIVDNWTPTPNLDEIFDTPISPPQPTEIADLFESDTEVVDAIPETVLAEETVITIPSLDEIFGKAVCNIETFANIVDNSAIELEEEIPKTVEELEPLSLNEVFSGFRSSDENVEITENGKAEVIESISAQLQEPLNPESDNSQFSGLDFGEQKTPTSIPELVKSVEQVFDKLPAVTEFAPITAVQNPQISNGEIQDRTVQQQNIPTGSAPASTQLSVRVDLERLERMNNLVGELAINRNGLSLQNEQLQLTVQELLRRFATFQEMGNQLSELSDKMLVAPERGNREWETSLELNATANTQSASSMFDSLEMDRYGELHSLVRDSMEELAQLEEIVGDVVLLTGQSSQTIESQRQMVNHLRDDLMWARMLPLGEVLSRFPRNLRDLCANYNKAVDLKLSGTGVLVDKAVLEKLYDPLMHLLRNAFDHGIEPSEVRRQQHKSERGQIEIRAYHQGSQTIIEVRDDGQGVNLQRISSRAVELDLLTPEEVAVTPAARLLDLLFEPGFSTANKVSELSGRGVGLDIVRSQLRSLKGNVTVNSTPGKGTTFTLRIPLTLTIAKLLVCTVGTTAYALPVDSVEEIVIPKSDQIKLSGKQRLLHWRKRIVPVFNLAELLDYAVPMPEATPTQALVSVPAPEDWAPPLLLLRQDQQLMALEIDRLITEQELVIKPFGAALAPPGYIYGCTILGDGSIIPVIDGATLLSRTVGEEKNAVSSTTISSSPPSAGITKKLVSTGRNKASISLAKSPLILVVDDSIALRQTLALTLQKVGYRVVQARDGREAIEQLQQNSSIQLIICDVEMPNMNGFEFLNHRRQDPQLSKVPIAMLTSRSSDKHRKLATHLGASAYFTKPYLEQEFLAAVKDMISKDTPVLAGAI